MRSTRSTLLATLLSVSPLLVSLACSSAGSEPATDSTGAVLGAAGVGDPCVPGDEARPDFGGFAVTEVNVESRSSQCETTLCIANHFQGRVSCPYGQSCTTTDGVAPVASTVPPQLLARRAEDTVYCSCRCDGPAGTGPFCACPGGFECAPLLADFGLASGEHLEGSYCVKVGTAVTDPSALEGAPTCDATQHDCG